MNSTLKSVRLGGKRRETPMGKIDGKRRRPDRVNKPLDLIPVDLLADFQFASRILRKFSKSTRHLH